MKPQRRRPRRPHTELTRAGVESWLRWQVEDSTGAMMMHATFRASLLSFADLPPRPRSPANRQRRQRDEDFERAPAVHAVAGAAHPMKTVVGVVPLALTALAAQSPSPPVFRASTELVEVDAIVRDRTGAIVTDLGVGDFAVTEDGRPQQVEIATLVRQAPNAGRSALSTRPRVFVVVFDTPHLSPTGFRRVQAAALALFTREFVDGVDLGGVVTGGRLAGRGLTSRGPDLLAAVRNARPGLEPDQVGRDVLEWPRVSEAEALRIAVEERAVIADVVARACRDDPSQCTDPRTPADTESDVRLKATRVSAELRAGSARTLATIRSLLTALDAIDGPKTILLMSEGFAADESWDEVQHAIGLAARANARIYSLDARGLPIAGADVLVRAPDEATTRMLATLGGVDEASNSLAVDSGGFAVRNVNDLSDAMAEIARDASTYYVLGYRSDRPTNGRLRRVTVTVRRLGTTVRSRRAYLASPELLPTSRSGPTAPAALPSRVLAPGTAGVLVGAASATGQRTPTNERIREYLDLVRQYGAGDDSAAEIAGSWSDEEAAAGVRFLAGTVDALRSRLLALAALEQRRDKMEPARYATERDALATSLAVTYDALDTGHVAALLSAAANPVAAEQVRSRRSGDLEALLGSSDAPTGLPEPIARYLRAAAGLHTALAAAAWRGGAPDRMAAHLELSAVLFPRLLASADPSFTAVWCRIAGALLTSSDLQGRAVRQLDRCLAWLPDDAPLLLARGSALESASIVMSSLPGGTMLQEWPAEWRSAEARRKREAADYEAALRIDPDLAEARIRLAKVRLEAGNASTVLSPVPNDRVLGYWALLVAGAIDETRKDPDSAATRYRSALAAWPGAQSAALALARLTAVEGHDPDAAASLLREQLGAAGERGADSDPWWLYGMGQAWRAPEWLDELAARSRR